MDPVCKVIKLATFNLFIMIKQANIAAKDLPFTPISGKMSCLL